MLVISVSILTALSTHVPREEPIFRSHGVGFACHYIDSIRGRNVTDGDRRLVGRTLRGQASPPAGGGLPHARLALRGRGRRTGGLAPPEPRRYQRRREPGWMADHGGRAGVPEPAGLAQITARGA